MIKLCFELIDKYYNFIKTRTLIIMLYVYFIPYFKCSSFEYKSFSLLPLYILYIVHDF